jgi:hypothetical protein
VTWDVTAAVQGNGTVNLAVMPTGSDGTVFSSRNTSDTTVRPQLVVTLNSSTPPPPPPTGDWTFYGTAQGGPRYVYGVSADAGGNLWVAGGEEGLFVLATMASRGAERTSRATAVRRGRGTTAAPE